MGGESDIWRGGNMATDTPLKVLFLSVSLGLGHHQARRALRDAFLALPLPVVLQEKDTVDYLSYSEKMLTREFYQFALSYAPWIYREFYHFTDRDHLFNFITPILLRTGFTPLQKDVFFYKPEVVINTFWLPAALVGQLEGKRPFNVLIMTDYAVHHHWVRPEVDLLLVPHEETRTELIARGLLPEQVVATGIPISEQMVSLRGKEKAFLRKKHGLHPEWSTILLSAGGTGTYRMGEVLEVLGNLGRRVQVILLAGTTKRGREYFGSACLHHIGFSEHLPELLAASDMVLGKAGGLTVAEATALGIPMLIFQPIPGHEEGNARFLERHGAGVWVRDASHLRREILRVLDNECHQKMSQAALYLGQPNAASEVANLVRERLQKKH